MRLLCRPFLFFTFALSRGGNSPVKAVGEPLKRACESPEGPLILFCGWQRFVAVPWFETLFPLVGKWGHF